MSKYLFYRFLNKHVFLRHILIGVRYAKDKTKLNEIIGRTKNCFEIKSYGHENPGKIIYNITIDDKMSGFFALNRFVLDSLYCAEIMGFIPYVSIIHSKYNDSKTDNDNMFEYYYEQPAGINKDVVFNSIAVTNYKDEHKGWLEDLYKSENSLLSGYDFDKELINQLAEVSKKNLKLKKDIIELLNRDIDSLQKKNKTVGIHYRGNAFNVGFYGHPVCLRIEDYYPFIDNVLKNGYDNIFVATDDMNALKQLIEKYQNKILYYKDVSRSDNGIDVQDDKNRNKKTGRRLGYEVLRDVKTLASCDSFICGKSQVSFAVMIEKKARDESFEYFNMIDHGLHSKDSQGKVKKYMKISR